ncbi:MAG: hypothetical protein ABNH53_16040 [Henriciella sp.]
MVTFDLSDIESTALATDMGNASLNWVEWVTDDRLLLSITTYVDYRSGKVIPRKDWGNPEKYIFPISVIRIVAMDRDGNNPVYMFGEDRSLNRNFYLGGVVSFLPQDPEHILMAARRGGDLDLFKLSVTDGSSERIAEGTDNTYCWFVDREGEPAFRYNTNNRGTVIYIYTREDRKNGKIKWRKTKTIRLNRNKQGDAATEFSPLSPGPEDTTYYVAARPEGEDKTGIYLYDFENDEFLETVRVHERLDIERGFFNRDTKELQGVWYHDDELVIEYADAKVQRHMDGLEKYFGKGINVVPMMSNRAGDVWLVRTYGPTDAGSYHIYDLNQTKARELGSNKTVFRSRVFGEA